MQQSNRSNGCCAGPRRLYFHAVDSDCSLMSCWSRCSSYGWYAYTAVAAVVVYCCWDFRFQPYSRPSEPEARILPSGTGRDSKWDKPDSTGSIFKPSPSAGTGPSGVSVWGVPVCARARVCAPMRLCAYLCVCACGCMRGLACECHCTRTLVCTVARARGVSVRELARKHVNVTQTRSRRSRSRRRRASRRRSCGESVVALPSAAHCRIRNRSRCVTHLPTSVPCKRPVPFKVRSARRTLRAARRPLRDGNRLSLAAALPRRKQAPARCPLGFVAGWTCGRRKTAPTG